MEKITELVKTLVLLVLAGCVAASMPTVWSMQRVLRSVEDIKYTKPACPEKCCCSDGRMEDCECCPCDKDEQGAMPESMAKDAAEDAVSEKKPGD